MEAFQTPELLTMIAIRLPCRDINTLGSCCRLLHNALDRTNTVIWKTKFHELFDPMRIPPDDQREWHSHLSKRLQTLKELGAGHDDDDQMIRMELLLTLFREHVDKNGYWLNRTIANRNWTDKIKMPLKDVDQGLRLIQIFTGFSLVLPLPEVASSQLDAESFDRPRWVALHAITAHCHSVLDEFSPARYPQPATIYPWWRYCLGDWHGIFVVLRPGRAWPSPKFRLRIDLHRVEGHTLEVKGHIAVRGTSSLMEGRIGLSEDESFVHWDLTVHDEKEEEGQYHCVGYQPAPGRVVVSGIAQLWDDEFLRQDGEAYDVYRHKIFSAWPAETVLYRDNQNGQERPDSIWKG
jgi:hypothetical protein